MAKRTLRRLKELLEKDFLKAIPGGEVYMQKNYFAIYLRGMKLVNFSLIFRPKVYIEKN